MFIQASASTGSQTAATFAANVPNAANGNLLLAFQMTALGIGGAPAVPTGWLLQDRQTTAALDLACYYRVALNEPSTYTFNNSSGLGTKSHVWMISVVVSVTSPATAPEANTKGTGTSTTASAASITTTQANELVFGAYGIGTNTGETITPNSFDGDFGTLAATECKLVVAHITLQPGATGAKTATISGAGLIPWEAMLVAVGGPAVQGGGGSSLGLFHKLRTTGGWVLKKRIGRKLR